LNRAPKPYVEEGARVIQHQPAFVQPDDFPAQSQLDSLLRIVHSAYPKLAPAGDLDKYKAGFRLSFLSPCHIRRRDGIDKQHTMSFWRDLGQDTLSSLNVSGKLDLAPFVAAVIASGDIAYTHPNHPQNFSMSAGLIFGGAGRAYSGAWRKVFDAGKVSPRSRLLFLRMSCHTTCGSSVAIGASGSGGELLMRSGRRQ
jgi:hypothetical protein